MALTNVDRVRNKTSRDTNILPTQVVQDYLDENTDDSGYVNINCAIADVLDYLASAGMGSDVKKWTRGPVSVEMTQTYRDLSNTYRALGGCLGGALGGGVIVGLVTRDGDWPATSDVEYASEDLLP